MPELPEVEVLARHLAPALKGKTIRGVTVRRAKVLKPTLENQFESRLRGATFLRLVRRGKYLLFHLRPARGKQPFQMLGHLGMTGRMYLQGADQPAPKHAAVILHLGARDFIYEDTRYFGRLTLDLGSVENLGPEPFSGAFSPEAFAQALKRSAQSIKVKLLDQSVVAGVGNIYASEALFRARISPRIAARRLSRAQVTRLHQEVRRVLQEAIDCGSTIPLDWSGKGKRNGLFYYGSTEAASPYYVERLQVYDRHGHPCPSCQTAIKRITQAARSTYFCPKCQR
jgi:formamidopyrimidine-DNA glycosylase